MSKCALQDRRGLSVVSAIMGLMIVGISMAAFCQLFHIQMKETAKLQRRGAMEDIRRLIRLVVDCKKTTALLPQQCTSDYISVLDPNGTTFLASTSPGKTIGKYLVRAKCRGTSIKTFEFYVKDPSGAENLLFPSNLPFVCGAT